MKTLDEQGTVCSLTARRALWDGLSSRRRQQQARLKRILVRIIIEAKVRTAQERVLLAEDKHCQGTPSLVERPYRSGWQHFLEVVGLRKSLLTDQRADALPSALDEVETAKAQLERLMATDAPRLLKTAEAVARAIDGQDDAEDLPLVDERPRVAQRRGRKSSAEDQA